MANCPHCGRKLHLYDWRPECPGCGTNLNYYNANQRLLDESEKAEIEHTLFQPKIDRAKAAYAGSAFAVIRIVLSLLPVGALFLPLLTDTNGGADLKVNVIGIYKIINGYGFGNIFQDALKTPLCLAAALLLISAAMIILSLVLITMSLGKHGTIRVIVTYAFMLLCAVGALLAAAFGCAKGPVPIRELGLVLNSTKIPLQPGAGAYLYAALFVVLFLYNIFLIKKGVPVKYTTCLIGGLTSEEYFRCVDAGMSKSQIQRRMLLALAELEEQQAQKIAAEGKQTA